jgi:hypothetical protein
MLTNRPKLKLWLPSRKLDWRRPVRPVPPFDAPHPCAAHTFINRLLDADNGADLTNWNYYTTPNAAAEAGPDQELLDFVNDPATIAGGEQSLKIIVDTGDFELEYTAAFIGAKG